MIRNRLIPEIEKEFAGWEMSITPEENPIVRFAGFQKEVVAVVVYDDGDEATICIEGITHGHFNAYDDSLKEAERDRTVTEDVIRFLKALFSDRVLLHVSEDKRSGGWTRLDLLDSPARLSREHRYYLWSKPYEPET